MRKSLFVLALVLLAGCGQPAMSEETDVSTVTSDNEVFSEDAATDDLKEADSNDFSEYKDTKNETGNGTLGEKNTASVHIGNNLGYGVMAGTAPGSHDELICPEPNEYTDFKGHLYLLYDNAGSFSEARSLCESYGGHLATITSKEEDEYIYNWLIGFNVLDAYFGLFKGSNGLEWVTGEPVLYTNWSPGEPNSSSESYGEYYHKSDPGTWNDNDFNVDPYEDHLYYICEIDGNFNDGFKLEEKAESDDEEGVLSEEETEEESSEEELEEEALTEDSEAEEPLEELESDEPLTEEEN